MRSRMPVATPPRAASGQPPGTFSGRRAAWTISVLCLVGFVLLTVIVSTHRADRFDLWARGVFRPHDEWGDLQIRVDVIVEGLKPRNCAAFLAVVVVAASVVRRSWRPAICTGIVCVLGAGLTLAVKASLGRLDTHHVVGGIGGSYPSGHVVGVLLVAGCAVLILSRVPGWLAWLGVALVGAVMSWALLVQAAHWLTDVGGGVLLAVAVLAAATTLPFHASPGRHSGASHSGVQRLRGPASPGSADPASPEGWLEDGL